MIIQVIQVLKVHPLCVSCNTNSSVFFIFVVVVFVTRYCPSGSTYGLGEYCNSGYKWLHLCDNNGAAVSEETSVEGIFAPYHY